MSAHIAVLSNMPSLEEDITAIKDCWKKVTSNYVDGVIKTGQQLIAAQERHGETLRQMAKDLPFGWQTAGQLMCIARSKGIASAGNTGSLPPNWTMLYDLTRLEKLDENAIAAGISNGTINPRMARKDIRDMLEQTAPKKTAAISVLPSKSSSHGPRIRPPGGRSVSAWVRSLMEEEKEFGTLATIKKSGINPHTFKAAKEIIALNELALKPNDAAICKQAILQMDATAGVASAHRMVLPIIQKVWQGKKGIQHSVEGAQRLSNEFRDRVSSLVETCEMASTFPVAYLTREAGKPLIRELKSARQAINQLLAAITIEIGS
jgi:hypothetical protein